MTTLKVNSECFQLYLLDELCMEISWVLFPHNSMLELFCKLLSPFLNSFLKKYSPSKSAPSSTSPIRPEPAEDSSSKSDSVLRSNALFSMPLVGVLHNKNRM